MIQIKLSPFINDILTTTVTAVATIGASIIVTRWLAQGLGPVEFGAYSLARRVVATIIPLTTLAMGVALPRYLGMHHGKKPVQQAYLLSAVILAVTLTTLGILLSISLSDTISIWIFHDSKYASLFYAVLFMLFGLGFHTIIYGYYRGIGKIKIANLWQICVMALGPLVAVRLLVERRSAAEIVTVLGGLFALAIIPVAYLCMKALSEVRKNLVRTASKELVRYGGPRIPAGLAFAGLLTMAPFLAPYFGSLKDAGYLVVGQSIFRIMEGAVVAFGLVALPRVARYAAEGRNAALKENIQDLNAFIFQIGLFIGLHLYIWADLVILAWLGADYHKAIPMMRVLVISLPAYLGYVILRSVIDAVEVRAVNSVNILIGLGAGSTIGISLAFGGLGVLGLAVGTAAGIFVIGTMSVFYLWQRYRFTLEMAIPTLAANGLFLLVAWIAHQWIVSGNSLFNLLYAFGIESLMFLIYLFLLWYWKIGWIMQIGSHIKIKIQPTD